MRRRVHVLEILEGSTRNLFLLKMNLERGLNEISNAWRRFASQKGFSIRYGNDSNTGKISMNLELIKSERDSPWILLSRRQDLFLEVDDVKSAILYILF